MIKNYLETLRQLRREETEQEVSNLIEILGDTPSIKTIEAVLKHYKAIDQKIISEGLLEDMDDMEIDTFDGENVKAKVKLSVSASIKNPETGYQWLIDNDYGDLLKDTIDFPKGELDEDTVAYLNTKGLSYKRKTAIHPATLKKVMKDRFEDGQELPDESVIKVSHFPYVEVKFKN